MKRSFCLLSLAIALVAAPLGSIASKLEQGGFVVAGGTPEQFAELLKGSIELYDKAVKAVGVRPE